MARALAYNGRATDAKAYLDAAVRVAPHGSSSRLLLAGLVYFSLGQFEGAIAALDVIDPKTFNFLNNQQRLFLLAAAHAHLGHAEMSAKSAADLETYRDANGLRAVSYLPFRQPADTARLLTGLTNAGVPDLPFGYRWDSKDRLTGEEIKLLIFGNEVRGRDMDTGETYTRKTGLDGSSGISIGSFSRKGTSKVDGNLICSLWDIAIAMNCATIFRNPNGTRAGRNEYVFVTHEQRVEFSVVE
ncbi:tetratricopeptide repeat protein [Rhizobiaceae bacterium n13]|uniref:Tetratricopeptide repeat protein n=1 Tax=Ferirhizobium litorale TaxID=2927786 RepID=A0AAE3QG20_9HYPH|nr:tetratricopeptide repeat protein [Fererhizobium litorale]MDI7862268.1 tetratricopeptide repeat protein [Fererhizobium litorale]MDI7922458.1 tetratricopeptide repeat protein [Fererhizobium litorale]